MIDGALMAKLLSATNPEKRLILLGDKDQLASVEVGSVFGDLCKTEGSGSVFDGHVIRLTKSWLFDPHKGIGLFSRSVMEGEQGVYKTNQCIAGYLTQWGTVFAMTIKKSQGSEFDNVLVLLPDNRDVRILTLEFLYTAVTRARSRVLVQASQDVLEETVRKRISRVSGLANRLKV